MADYTFVVVGILLAFVILLILMVRMITIIQPGQLGIVYLLGTYMRALNPGFNIVSPLARVRKVVPGSGSNGVIGLMGKAESDLGPDRPLGPVRVGNRMVSARAASTVHAGEEVRVIEDTSAGVVLVGKERGGTGMNLPAKPN